MPFQGVDGHILLDAHLDRQAAFAAGNQAQKMCDQKKCVLQLSLRSLPLMLQQFVKVFRKPMIHKHILHNWILMFFSPTLSIKMIMLN